MMSSQQKNFFENISIRSERTFQLNAMNFLIIPSAYLDHNRHNCSLLGMHNYGPLLIAQLLVVGKDVRKVSSILIP